MSRSAHPAADLDRRRSAARSAFPLVRPGLRGRGPAPRPLLRIRARSASARRGRRSPRPVRSRFARRRRVPRRRSAPHSARLRRPGRRRCALPPPRRRPCGRRRRGAILDGNVGGLRPRADGPRSCGRRRASGALWRLWSRTAAAARLTAGSRSALGRRQIRRIRRTLADDGSDAPGRRRRRPSARVSFRVGGGRPRPRRRSGRPRRTASDDHRDHRDQHRGQDHHETASDIPPLPSSSPRDGAGGQTVRMGRQEGRRRDGNAATTRQRPSTTMDRPAFRDLDSGQDPGRCGNRSPLSVARAVRCASCDSPVTMRLRSQTPRVKPTRYRRPARPRGRHQMADQAASSARARRGR